MSSTKIDFEPLLGPTDRPRPESEPVGPKLKAGIRWLLTRAIFLVVLLTLPFVILVRVSVLLYDVGIGSGWLPLLGGGIATGLLLVAYAMVAGRRLTGSWKLPPWTKRVILGIVGAYAVYAVLFLSASNAKTSDIQGQFTAVNPVLRLATSTLVLADPGLVVTDASRTLEDYRRMGLPPNEASLHFEQASGWVHALDLRTIGRSQIRNGFMALYFWGMGFQTLRHRGTADHLHVSLPIP